MKNKNKEISEISNRQIERAVFTARDKQQFGNKKGIIWGFVFGVIAGLLFLFTLSRIYPEEDLAGIVILTLLFSGLIFSFFGYLIQKYFVKRNKLGGK